MVCAQSDAATSSLTNVLTSNLTPNTDVAIIRSSLQSIGFLLSSGISPGDAVYKSLIESCIHLLSHQDTDLRIASGETIACLMELSSEFTVLFDSILF
jgi:hypothetical protein